MVFYSKTSRHINKCPQSYLCTPGTNSVVFLETELFGTIISHSQGFGMFMWFHIMPDLSQAVC